MPDFDHLPEALRNIIAAYGPPAGGYDLWWRAAWWTKSVLYRVSFTIPEGAVFIDAQFWTEQDWCKIKIKALLP